MAWKRQVREYRGRSNAYKERFAFLMCLSRVLGRSHLLLATDHRIAWSSTSVVELAGTDFPITPIQMLSDWHSRPLRPSTLTPNMVPDAVPNWMYK